MLRPLVWRWTSPRRGGLLAVLAALLLAAAQLGCGGSSPQTPATTPTPAPTAAPAPSFDLAPFRTLADQAMCARNRNSLFVIDAQYVLWAVEDHACADASYAYLLFGSTTDDLRCRASDSIAGPRRTCSEPSLADLFNTATAHLDDADLGLGPEHTVVQVRP